MRPRDQDRSEQSVRGAFRTKKTMSLVHAQANGRNQSQEGGGGLLSEMQMVMHYTNT